MIFITSALASYFSRAIYLATQFLDSLENPAYEEQTTEFKDYKIVMSMFFVGPQPRKKLERMTQKAFKNINQIAELYGLFMKFLNVEKASMVLTAEKKT